MDLYIIIIGIVGLFVGYYSIKIKWRIIKATIEGKRPGLKELIKGKENSSINIIQEKDLLIEDLKAKESHCLNEIKKLIDKNNELKNQMGKKNKKVEVEQINHKKSNKISNYLDILNIGLELKTQKDIPFEITNVYSGLRIRNSKGNEYKINENILKDYILKKDFSNSRRHYSYEPSIARYITEQLDKNINTSFNAINTDRKKIDEAAVTAAENGYINNKFSGLKKINKLSEEENNQAKFKIFLKEKNMEINKLSESNKKLISTKVAKNIFSKKVITKVLNKEDVDFILNFSEILRIQMQKQGKQNKLNCKLTYPIRKERWLTDRL